MDNYTMLQEEFSFRNLYRVICAHPERIAAEWTDGVSVRTETYAEFQQKAEKTAAFLQEHFPGNRGRFLGLQMDNHPWWPAIFWGMMMAGFKPLLIDFRLTDQSLADILQEADAAGLVTGELKPPMTSRPQIEAAVIMASPDKSGCLTADWADQTALCTSGTTGASRIYVYDGAAICHHLMNARAIDRENKHIIPASGGRMLAFLPFHHVFGFLTVYLWPAFFGRTLVYMENRSPEIILETCRKHRVTHIFAVPLLWNNVAKYALRLAASSLSLNEAATLRLFDVSLAMQALLPVEKRSEVITALFPGIQQQLFGPDIQFFISGGGRIPPDTLRVLNGLGYPLVSGFGMTEVGITSVALADDPAYWRHENLGHAVASIMYKIRPVEGISEPDVGELMVRGSSIHSGRMEQGHFLPPDTDDDGWFATGDLARLTADGIMTLEGRLKEVVINESGENVYPDQLEIIFQDIPGAFQTCVHGIPAAGGYDRLTLTVYAGNESMRQPMLAAMRTEIRALNDSLPLFKRIQQVLLAEEPLPVSGSFKVKRQLLCAMIEDGSLAVMPLDLHWTADQPVQEHPGEAGEEKDRLTEEIRDCFARVLGIPAAVITDDAHFADDLGGDSLQSIGLLVMIEELYDLSIPDDEYYGCVNVRELTALIRRRLAQAGRAVAAETTEHEPVPPVLVKRFEDSREFAALLSRQAAMEGIANPFFVCHDSVLRDVSVVEGREVINFGSYNYLGMSGHPETVRAAQEAAAQYGTSASGSRLISGEKSLYRELEREIARFKHVEDALAIVSGHSTNVTFIGNFCGPRDLILYDALSHDSITQGCQLSRARSRAFPHNDYDALEKMLIRTRDRFEKVLIVVEGVYSMDGDIAPIPEFVRLKRQYGTFLMVDEAHSNCVIGKTGGGVDEYFGLNAEDIDIRMGTLSKGLGACGGYLAGSHSLIEYLRYSLPGFIFTAGMSPPVAAAALSAVQLVQRDHRMIERLRENVQCFISEARRRNLNTCLAAETAIVPILIGDDRNAYDISNRLLKRGVYVPPVVYPAVARGQSRLRFCVTSEHRREQIDRALDLLIELAGEMGIVLPAPDQERDLV